MKLEVNLAERKDAEGKSSIRLIVIDKTSDEPYRHEQIAFESADDTDIERMVKRCFDAAGRAIARRFAEQVPA